MCLFLFFKHGVRAGAWAGEQEPEPPPFFTAPASAPAPAKKDGSKRLPLGLPLRLRLHNTGAKYNNPSTSLIDSKLWPIWLITSFYCLPAQWVSASAIEIDCRIRNLQQVIKLKKCCSTTIIAAKALNLICSDDWAPRRRTICGMILNFC